MLTGARALLVMAIAIAASGCRYRPTQITLLLDTNVSSAREATVTITVVEGEASIDSLRALRGAPQVTRRDALPASLTLVPRDGATRSGALTVLATMTVAAGAGQPAAQIERLQRLRWIERAPQQSRLVFNARCSDRAVGCTSATGLGCTVSRRCIEQGATCGDTGECVALELPTVVIEPSTPLDATVAADVSAPIATDASAGRPDGSICDQPVLDATTVNAVSAGWVHHCSIRSGALYCAGGNGHGQLGINSRDATNAPARVAAERRWIDVAAGEASTCAVDEFGGVWCWGRNQLGQLGAGDNDDRLTPTRVAGLCGVRQIEGAYNTFCAVNGQGALFCWGDNAEGQLTDEASGAATRNAPLRIGAAHEWTRVSVGQGHACAIRASGTLHCWGRNLNSELGLGAGQPMQIRVPAQVGTFSDWRDVHVGQNSSCGVREGGVAHVWGDNDAWPSPYLAPTAVPLAAAATQCEVNTFHWCARDVSGSVWCAGRNVEGQLGDGTTVDRTAVARTTPGGPFERVAVGRFFTCAQSADGAVRCSGENNDGQLGLGDNNRRNALARQP